MCDESKKTDKETSEETKAETSKPRKDYFLNGVKIGYVAGITGLSILAHQLYEGRPIAYFNDIALWPELYYLIFILIFSSFIAIKHRRCKFKNICKEIIGISLIMIIIYITYWYFWIFRSFFY